MTITSPQNDTLKQLRRLKRTSQRARSGRFLAEGEDLIAEALRCGWEPLALLCAKGSGLAGTEVEPALLDDVSSLASGTRTIGIFKTRWCTEPKGPLCVALVGVGDPGNVGAVLRSALAFGAASVALGPGCADPFGPKGVRASMGAIFAVPIARFEHISELPGLTVALAARCGEPLDTLLDTNVSIVVGSEREGLPAKMLEAADKTAHIPIENESLNAAMAATVALYEFTRQRHRIPRR